MIPKGETHLLQEHKQKNNKMDIWRNMEDLLGHSETLCYNPRYGH